MKCRSCKYLRVTHEFYIIPRDFDDSLYVWHGRVPELWMCAHEDHGCEQKMLTCSDIDIVVHPDGPIISEDELPQPEWCPRKWKPKPETCHKCSKKTLKPVGVAENGEAIIICMDCFKKQPDYHKYNKIRE